MDDDEKLWLLQRQEKYRRLYNRPRFAVENGFHFQRFRPGGIFKEKTRERLLGTSRKVGRGKKENNFWYDVRETVKTALIDLQLFIEAADGQNVTKALTRESLEAIVRVFFARREQDDPKLVGQKAEIARLLAEYALEYLRQNSKYVTGKQLQDIIDSGKSRKG